MTYKTILVNLTTTDRAPALLSAATHLAHRFEAYLIALHVVPLAWVPAASPMDISGEIIAVQTRAYNAQAKAIRALFEATLAKGKLKGEWCQVEAKFHDPAEIVVAAGNATDLIMLSQPAKGAELLPTADTPERIMMEAGRPLLFVPDAGAERIIGGNVILAWNGSREATRAAFDAVPLLQAAKSVHVLAVNPETRAEELPWSSIVAALARHGIACKGSSAYNRSSSIADELRTHAAADGAGLLVMGGYGHSRLREFFFGGATYGMLARMPLPVFMAH